MKVLSLLLIASVFALTGCKLLNFISMDPRPNTQPLTLPIAAQLQAQLNAHYVWLPPAYTDEFSYYTRAFSQDAENYFLRLDISNQHEETQTLFNKNATELGGLFDTRTGNLQMRILNQSIRKTAFDIFESQPSTQVVVFMTPYKEPVLLSNGLAQWANTEQKQSTLPGDSTESGIAISLRLNYMLRDEQHQLHGIGLDMQDQRYAQDNKYRFIVKHVFDPIFKNK